MSTQKHRIRICDDFKMRKDLGYKKSFGVDGYSHTSGEYVISDDITKWMVSKVFSEKETQEFVLMTNEELIKLLRETVMRAHFALPENEQDEKWFDANSEPPEFITRLFDVLKLGRHNLYEEEHFKAE